MEPEDSRELLFTKEFEEAKCLTLSEVSILLNQTTQRRTQDKISAPQSDVFLKVKEYANRFARFQNSKEYVREIRRLLNRRNLHEFEIASLVNLCPGNAEEAITLIPSLRRLDEQTIQEIIDDLDVFAMQQDEAEED
uniref:RNA polymerase Rpb4/RPC9 core domain-containing protein n=1 Tax=Percolomonas cosmopolitus TaxID=63605 RepID=A0A7S1KP43_9EUKA|mmetsp:Transcript_3478/g.13265  ORF Transcript_3478/g.13265 Transcript_3478/m.13265 type:complete len:137 (+) Transcript_3478:188-598(+)|eukprot:CAMPEP_0117446048 /NCGR_PEP_ID=MMETSP0759-20121206/6125_1 /TAXON_ID=63605 /ORGANISM="Percolomonas cosmopolitus, Strain WS" /LENGTH=136 /DNA_ID=CAMNT_0005238273 /DNA_START=179 /DNA_END=589 /DNA_ORIENTATION=+